jgi:hypothetical protein
VTNVEVAQQLIQIAREAITDPEAATSRERRLLRDVLMQIGEETTASGELARAAVRTFELAFRRIQ